MVDALGNPLRFHLTGGQAHDLDGADHLLANLKADTLIADKAYDADQRVITRLAEVGKTTVIPSKSSRKVARDHDRHLYKARHLMECAPPGGQNGRFELTPSAGLPENGSHDEASFP